MTIVGFATAFELDVMAWSASRRGAAETVIAAVVGSFASFAYNATMTLGAAALVGPLLVADPGRLHLPAVIMVASLAAALGLSWVAGKLTRPVGIALMASYPAFVVAVIVR